MIQIKANGKVYFFDESAKILDLLGMKAFDVQDDPDYDSKTQTGPLKEFSVPTPLGRIRAKASADPDNPGIFVSYLEPCGTERSTLCLEYNGHDEAILGYRWSPMDPDGDPTHTFQMGPAENRTEDTE